jgi:hypothetical protein
MLRLACLAAVGMDTDDLTDREVGRGVGARHRRALTRWRPTGLAGETDLRRRRAGSVPLQVAPASRDRSEGQPTFRIASR